MNVNHLDGEGERERGLNCKKDGGWCKEQRHKKQTHS